MSRVSEVRDRVTHLGRYLVYLVYTLLSACFVLGMEVPRVPDDLSRRVWSINVTSGMSHSPLPPLLRTVGVESVFRVFTRINTR